MVDSTTLSAMNAYRSQLKLMQNASESMPEESSGTSFSDMVNHAMKESVNTIQKSENLQLDSMSGGKVDLSELVTAVANAELTLNTVVAVRDRVINAYQDIIKMAI